MKLTFRWYGDSDPVTLSEIRQIPCMSGIVSAVYDTPPGEIWPVESILALKSKIEAAYRSTRRSNWAARRRPV